MAAWTDFDIQKALAQISANPNYSGFGVGSSWSPGTGAEFFQASNDTAALGMPTSASGGYFFDGYGISPVYGQEFDPISGNMNAGPLKEYMVTKHLGKDQGGRSLFRGGGSAHYENQPFDVYDPTGKFLRSGTFKNMGADSFTRAMELAVVLGPFAGAALAGGAVAGAGGAAGGAAGGGVGATVTTAAEAAAAQAALQSQLAPYLAGSSAMGAGAAGLGGSGVTVPTAAEVAAGQAALQSELAPYLAGAGAGAAGGGAAAGSTGGAAGGLGSLLKGAGGLIGPAATLIGAGIGSKGTQNEATSTRSMDPRMDKLFYGDLAPRAQGLLKTQMPQAQAAGNALTQKGMGLLNTPIAGNGVGKVKMDAVAPLGQAKMDTVAPLGQAKMDPVTMGSFKYEAPNTATNPYLKGVAADMARERDDFVGQQLSNIRGNQILKGTMGSTRQGVAQGEAIGDAYDAYAGAYSNLYGNAYESDMNRALQKYGLDQDFAMGKYGIDSSRSLGKYTADQDFSLGRYGIDTNRALGKYTADQNFYGNQRGQDIAAAGLGAGLVDQGLNTPWKPLQNTAGVFSPFTGYGTTTSNTQQGDGWQGALGGALGMAQFGKNMGWW